MRTILNALRLRLESGLSERQTARSVDVPRSTVQDDLLRFRASGLSWPVPADVAEAALERALFTCDVHLPATKRPVPGPVIHSRIRPTVPSRDIAHGTCVRIARSAGCARLMIPPTTAAEYEAARPSVSPSR